MWNVARGQRRNSRRVHSIGEGIEADVMTKLPCVSSPSRLGQQSRVFVLRISVSSSFNTVYPFPNRFSFFEVSFRRPPRDHHF